MAKIAIIPPNLPFFFDFSCQTQDNSIRVTRLQQGNLRILHFFKRCLKSALFIDKK
jgi:hypothetical protein